MKKIPIIDQKMYNANPTVSGWFALKEYSFIYLSNRKSIKADGSPTYFHLKGGLLHHENGPALLQDHCSWLEFHINGVQIPTLCGIQIDVSVKFDGEKFTYKQNYYCKEWYTRHQTCEAGIDILHRLEGPCITEWTYAGVLKEGQYVRDEKAKIWRNDFYINGQKVDEEQHLRYIKSLDLKKKLKGLE